MHVAICMFRSLLECTHVLMIIIIISGQIFYSAKHWGKLVKNIGEETQMGGNVERN